MHSSEQTLGNTRSMRPNVRKQISAKQKINQKTNKISGIPKDIKKTKVIKEYLKKISKT